MATNADLTARYRAVLPKWLATYYAESGAGRLVVLDRRSLTVIGTAIPVGHHPRKVAWHPGRNAAYVLNWGRQSRSISIVTSPPETSPTSTSATTSST